MHLHASQTHHFPMFLAAEFCEKSEPRSPGRGTAALTTHRTGASTMADANLLRRVTVYKATCRETGREYIGITARTMEARRDEHFATARHRGRKTLFHREIKARGPENFSFEHIFTAFGIENACAVEQLLIAEYRTEAPAGLNLSSGGEGSVGRVLSPIAREAISAKVRALWADPAYRARMQEAAKNAPPPTEKHVEHLRRLAAAKKGKPRSRESVEKGRASLKGHPVSEEMRAKIGAKSKGRKRSAESRLRQSDALRAAHAAGAFKERNAKLSAAVKKSWENPSPGRLIGVQKHRGLKHSEEARAKISAARLRPMSDEERARRSAGQKNRKWSESQREAIMAFKRSPEGIEAARKAGRITASRNASKKSKKSAQYSMELYGGEN